MVKYQAMCAVVLAAAIAGPVSADVVNLDLNSNDTLVDTTHVGADGILSTTGTFWNGAEYNQNVSIDLRDEFGNATPLKYIKSATNFSTYVENAAANDLQNTGDAFGGFRIVGLAPAEAYTVAFYLGDNTGIFGVEHGGGSTVVQVTNAVPTYSLPGALNTDYSLLNLTAKHFGGGVYGFEVPEGLVDGVVLGLQVSGTVPEPATLTLVACAVPLLLRKRSAKRAGA